MNPPKEGEAEVVINLSKSDSQPESDGNPTEATSTPARCGGPWIDLSLWPFQHLQIELQKATAEEEGKDKKQQDQKMP